MLAFEHLDLQTQGHDFESKAISRAKESSEPFKETPYQFENGASLHGPVVIRGYIDRPLVSQRNEVLATDRVLSEVSPGCACAERHRGTP